MHEDLVNNLPRSNNDNGAQAGSLRKLTFQELLKILSNTTVVSDVLFTGWMVSPGGFEMAPDVLHFLFHIA